MKLHELLAVEGNLEDQAKKTRTDLAATFEKKRWLRRVCTFAVRNRQIRAGNSLRNFWTTRNVRRSQSSNAAAARCSSDSERMHLNAFKLNVSLTAATFAEHTAREQFATELRRIADAVEEGSAFAESGHMRHADMGSWEFHDPRESQS